MATPAGAVTPSPRIWGYEKHFGDRKEPASAGRVFALRPGVSRLDFTGQTWPVHPTKGIDFSVFVVADEEEQAHVGNWAHAWGGGSGGELRQANGRPFEERQHILRVRSFGGFRVLLVTYPRGRRPGDLQVQRNGAEVAVTAAGRTVRLAADGKHR